MAATAASWPPLRYEEWRDTCDTLHAHTQLLGKLAVALAPPEPQLQHAALRLTARGWETAPLPAPDASGSLVVVLDLHRHEAVVEHSDGRIRRTPLSPDRAVAEVTRQVLSDIAGLVGPVHIDPRPQETPWSVPLDQDFEHATYDTDKVAEYFAAATQAALVLAKLRAPYRGRSSPVNAWWGSFDLAVSLFSGEAVDPRSNDFIMRNSANAQQIEIGWWPGDHRYPPTGVLRVRRPDTRRLRPSNSGPGGGTMGHRPRRVHPRLGRRPPRREPAPRRTRLRPLRHSTRVPGLRLGPRARRERPRRPAATYLGVGCERQTWPGQAQRVTFGL